MELSYDYACLVPVTGLMWHLNYWNCMYSSSTNNSSIDDVRVKIFQIKCTGIIWLLCTSHFWFLDDNFFSIVYTTAWLEIVKEGTLLASLPGKVYMRLGLCQAAVSMPGKERGIAMLSALSAQWVKLLASFPGFPTVKFWSLAVCINGGGRPGRFYHVKYVCVYLGR